MPTYSTFAAAASCATASSSTGLAPPASAAAADARCDARQEILAVRARRRGDDAVAALLRELGDGRRVLLGEVAAGHLRREDLARAVLGSGLSRSLGAGADREDVELATGAARDLLRDGHGGEGVAAKAAIEKLGNYEYVGHWYFSYELS